MRKMTDKIEKLKTELRELTERVSEQDDLINQLNDELDYALSMAYKVDDIIAAWNNRHPNDTIHTKKERRPASDYAMTDQEWKEATRVPHPRERKTGA